MAPNRARKDLETLSQEALDKAERLMAATDGLATAAAVIALVYEVRRLRASVDEWVTRGR